MSEENQTSTQETKAPVIETAPLDAKPDQLAMLKKRADTMGVSYGPNIGVDELAKRIKSKLEGTAMPDAVPASETIRVTPAVSRQDLINDAMKLVRVKIANLNPNKKDLSGEIVTVSNRFVGAVRRFIPFGEVTDEGWHIENILYQELLDRRFLDIRVVKKRGQPDRVTEQWVKEFSLEVLEPLTTEELRQLSNRQAAANGMAI